jgi:multimeric flavodoxin WrbA
MYWGYMTAQMKTMLDRMEAIASRRILKGKVFVVILTFRHHYESTLAFFKRVFLDYFGVELHTVLFRSVDQSTGEDIHVNARPEMLDSAYRLGVDLSSHPAKNHTTSLS